VGLYIKNVDDTTAARRSKTLRKAEIGKKEMTGASLNFMAGQS
jgi:hypothetical protein